MAENLKPVAEAPASQSQIQEELKARDEWFTATPDPWSEIALLQYGGDRTFASTVNRMVINAEPAQRPAMEAKLLNVLGRPELTDAGRAFVCRMLGLIGTEVCVPAVVPLLAQDSTADDARLALDSIADPKIDEAYRAALGKLHGAARIGVIGSIAMRGDAQAEEILTAMAISPTESIEVRAAAERAVKRLVAKP